MFSFLTGRRGDFNRRCMLPPAFIASNHDIRRRSAIKYRNNINFVRTADPKVSVKDHHTLSSVHFRNTIPTKQPAYAVTAEHHTLSKLLQVWEVV
jgi:hypothetical protein